MDIMLLQNEISSLQHELAMKSTVQTWSIKRVLTEPTVRLPLFLVCLMQFGQQLSGINAVFYYSETIFQQAGLATHAVKYAIIGTGVANIFMAIVSVPIMSIFSRRKVFFLSCYLCIGCLIILCISLALIVSIQNNFNNLKSNKIDFTIMTYRNHKNINMI
jgi:MFS family permease